MQIRQLTIQRFRGIEHTTLHPGPRTVLLGPNNAAKSTILEALDIVLHPGLGRPRLPPDELDYYARDPSAGFEIAVVLGRLEGAVPGRGARPSGGLEPEDARGRP